MRTAAALILIATLTACGPGKDEPKLSPQAVETLNKMADWESNLPKCTDIWVEGKTLPKGYDGCKEGDTAVAGVGVSYCKDIEVYTYEPKGHGYFAAKQGKIQDGGEDYANTPEYRDVTGLSGDC